MGPKGVPSKVFKEAVGYFINKITFKRSSALGKKCDTKKERRENINGPGNLTFK